MKSIRTFYYINSKLSYIGKNTLENLLNNFIAIIEEIGISSINKYIFNFYLISK